MNVRGYLFMEKLDSTFYSNFKAYEIEFFLQAQETSIVQAFFGPAERGAVLNLLLEQLPDLAKELHNSNDIRPYALTPLSFNNKFLVPFKGGGIKIFSGNVYSFKMKLVLKTIYEKLVNTLLNSSNLKFQIYDINFLIVSIQLSQKPLLNIFPPSENIFNKVNSPNAWNIFFKTPTQFKSKYDTIIPFPIPSFIFNNLYHTWNYFFGTPNFITKELWFDFLEQKLYCRKHKIQTVQLKFGNSSSEIGFIGSCLIVSKEEKSPFNSFLTTLLELGETLNVGSKRTLGFGVINYDVRMPKTN